MTIALLVARGITTDGLGIEGHGEHYYSCMGVSEECLYCLSYSKPAIYRTRHVIVFKPLLWLHPYLLQPHDSTYLEWPRWSRAGHIYSSNTPELSFDSDIIIIT